MAVTWKRGDRPGLHLAYEGTKVIARAEAREGVRAGCWNRYEYRVTGHKGARNAGSLADVKAEVAKLIGSD